MCVALTQPLGSHRHLCSGGEEYRNGKIVQGSAPGHLGGQLFPPLLLPCLPVVLLSMGISLAPYTQNIAANFMPKL